MTEAMPLILFLVLFLLLLMGYPVAFTLGGVSVLLGLMTFGADFFNLLPLRIWGVMTNYVLLAVPCSSTWASCWKNQAWPRICWRPWPCSSAGCGEDSRWQW